MRNPIRTIIEEIAKSHIGLARIDIEITLETSPESRRTTGNHLLSIADAGKKINQFHCHCGWVCLSVVPSIADL
jgi:hypothetical protein